MPIKVLDDHTINKIAAGEVVERPASVLRELLENSIDAGATIIQIQLQGGGSKLIRIRDNGSGMSRDDARMCLLRHATSKITSDEDIFHITSLGFRGEAIPSIASISKFEILTRREEDSVGTRITVEGGKTVSVEDAGCPVGTQITVKDLFFNVPARLKFLRRESTELSHCIATVTQEILIRPELDVTLTHKQSTLIRASKVDSIPKRAKTLFPKEGTSLIDVSVDNAHFKIQAWISPIGIHFAGSSMSYMYVNKRHIKDTSVRRAIRDAYQALIPKGRHPTIILMIEVSPQDVDVNVHPAKTEVRFKNIRSLSQLIQFGFRKRLQEEGIKTEIQLQSSQAMPTLASVMGKDNESNSNGNNHIHGNLGTNTTQTVRSAQANPIKFSNAFTKLAPQERQQELFSNTGIQATPQNTSVTTSSSANPFVSSHKEEERFLHALDQQDSLSQNQVNSVANLEQNQGQTPSTSQNAESPTLDMSQETISNDVNVAEESTQAESTENTANIANPQSTSPAYPPSVYWTDEHSWNFEDAEKLDNPSVPSADAVMFRWPFYVPKKIRDRDDKEAFLLQYKEMHSLLPTPRFADLRVIGQLGKTYLLCEGGGELVIVDQHAAHERIVLHRLQQNMSKQLGGLQQFLTPEIVEISVQRYHALLPRLDVLEYYGFSIEPFGAQTFVIRQAPMLLMNIDYQEMLEGVADSIQEGIETTPLKEKIDLMLATKACHNSIRAGEILSELQIQNLLHELDGVDFEVCAHGRPVVIRYAMSEFEKRFHRN